MVKTRRSLWCSLVMLVVLVMADPCALFASDMAKDKFAAGENAPDFILKNLAGTEVKLNDFKGKSVVLLNFWGLRCGACLEEMPYLDVIAKKYAGKGVVVLGVDTDGVDSQTVVETLKEVKVNVTYQLLLDPDFKVTDVYTNFLVPLTIVIDRKGVIQYIHTGFEKGVENHYEDAVKKALAL